MPVGVPHRWAATAAADARDLFLQRGHGFDVLRACAGREPLQKAVVLTNYTITPVRQYAAHAGADAFFDKSFEMDGLVAYCANHAKALGESRAG